MIVLITFTRFILISPSLHYDSIWFTSYELYSVILIGSVCTTVHRHRHTLISMLRYYPLSGYIEFLLSDTLVLLTMTPTDLLLGLRFIWILSY